MRPRKWTNARMSGFFKSHGMDITPMSEPVNVKSTIRWKCLSCGTVFKTTFDAMYRQILFGNHRKNYRPCPECRKESKSDTVRLDALTDGSATSFYLAGVIAARGREFKNETATRHSSTCLSVKDRGVMKAIIKMLATDAVPSDNKTCFELTIRDSNFAGTSSKAAKIPPKDEKSARAWIRGFFDMKGHAELYRDNKGEPIYRVTVTGKVKMLRAVLASFKKYTGNDRGYIQTHHRHGQDTEELHFAGTRCSLTFLEWIHGDKTLPAPTAAVASHIAGLKDRMKKEEERRQRIGAAASTAAKACLKARQCIICKEAEKLGVDVRKAYAASYGVTPAGMPRWISEKLARTLNSRISMRRKVYRIANRTARKEDLCLSSVMCAVYRKARGLE